MMAKIHLRHLSLTCTQCGTGGMSAPKKFEPIPVKAEDAPNIYRTCSVKKFLKKKFAFFRQTQKRIRKLAPSRPPIIAGFCCYFCFRCLKFIYKWLK